MDKELADWSHSKGNGQWLIVHVETRDEWGSLEAVLRLTLLNFFIGNMGRGNDNNLIKFAKNIKLCGAAHLLKQRDPIQKDPDRL